MRWLSADEDWQVKGPVRLRAAILVAKSSGWLFRSFRSGAHIQLICSVSSDRCAVDLPPSLGETDGPPALDAEHAEHWAVDLRRALSRCPHASAERSPAYERAERRLAMAEHLLTIVEDSTDAPPNHPDAEQKPSMDPSDRQDLFFVATLNVIEAERLVPPLLPLRNEGTFVMNVPTMARDGDPAPEPDEEDVADANVDADLIRQAEAALAVPWANVNVQQLRTRIVLVRVQAALLRAQSGDPHL